MSRDAQRRSDNGRSDSAASIGSASPSDPVRPTDEGPGAEPDVVAHEDRDFEDLPWCIACSG